MALNTPSNAAFTFLVATGHVAPAAPSSNRSSPRCRNVGGIVLTETPDKTFAEYVPHTTGAATGRLRHQLFTGYLVAEAGEIKLLRESFNPLAMAQAQLPNGVADIGSPSHEVHS